MALLYEYKCQGCGRLYTGTARSPSHACACGDTLRRKFSVNTPRPNCFFQAHWNRSVGEWVTSQKDFEDKLKKKGEAVSNRLGMEHNYVPHDHGDKLGVTDDGK